MSETVRTAGRRRVHGIARQARVHTPSIAFRHLPPKEGCRIPVIGVLSLAGAATSIIIKSLLVVLVAARASDKVLPRSSRARHLVEVIINSKFSKFAGALNSRLHQGTALTSGTEDGATTRLHVAAPFQTVFLRWSGIVGNEGLEIHARVFEEVFL